MPPEFHQRVRKLFDQALELPESERFHFLEVACPDDAAILEAARKLVEAHGKSRSFLENNADEVQRLGRYRLIRELGRGAMGIVYEAVDPLIGRTVAVKTFQLRGDTYAGETGLLREHLFREARSAGVLFHPGIVIIFDVGEAGETAFIAMECVEGPSLYEMLAPGRRLSHTETVSILRQTAAALDYAHENGVVHRDIKPGNIMLHKSVTVKVTDFGIAKIMSPQQHTRTGTIMGTPSYMSPEQIEGRALDGRSDQFSLAIVAYELLTGSRPFQADSLVTLAHMIVYAPRPSAKAANPELPAVIDQVFERALSKVPEERYVNCAALVKELENALREVNGAPVPVLKTAPRIAHARSGFRVLALTVAAALIAAALSGFLLYRRFTSPPAQPAAVTVTQAPRSKPASLLVTRSAANPQSNETAKVEVKQPAALPAIVTTGITRARQIYTQAAAKRDGGQATAALALLREAAALGDPRAMFDLGNIYTEGEGVTKDESEGVRWFRRAADAGSSSGMVHLGASYYLGTGVPEDYGAAAYWYRKAADAGNPNAMYNLARLYERGEGVVRDTRKSRDLYERSAALGNADAQAELARLSRAR